MFFSADRYLGHEPSFRESEDGWPSAVFLGDPGQTVQQPGEVYRFQYYQRFANRRVYAGMWRQVGTSLQYT